MSTIDLNNKIVLAHRGFYDKASQALYRENSKEVCAASSRKEYISIIELDVRKSKDGILYCYHGTLPQYYWDLKSRREFSRIKEKYNVDTLADILKVIDPDKKIFLDLKDRKITKDDIVGAFGGRSFKEVILANKSVTFLDTFSDMPKEFVKLLNGNILCNFYDLENLKRKNFKYFEVTFPFQVREKIVKRVKDVGLEFRCSGFFFLTRNSFWKKVNRYSLAHVSSDFI